MISSSRVMIYDARPYLNAQANRVKSGGFESTKFYKNAEIEFCDIDNIHEVKSAYRKMLEIPSETRNFERAANF